MEIEYLVLSDLELNIILLLCFLSDGITSLSATTPN